MPASDVRAAVKLVTGEPLAIDKLVARKKAGERIAELRDFAAEVMRRAASPTCRTRRCRSAWRR